MSKMNKSEISRLVGNKLGANHRDGITITNAFFDCMTEVLAEGRTVEIRNFGTFKVRSYGERQGRNPKTGEAVVIPEKTKVLFKAGKKLKREVTS